MLVELRELKLDLLVGCEGSSHRELATDETGDQELLTDPMRDIAHSNTSDVVGNPSGDVAVAGIFRNRFRIRLWKDFLIVMLASAKRVLLRSIAYVRQDV